MGGGKPELPPNALLGENIMNCIEGHLRRIEGRLKTFVEAITEDPTQSKARKDVIAQLVWSDAQEMDAQIRRMVS